MELWKHASLAIDTCIHVILGNKRKNANLVIDNAVKDLVDLIGALHGDVDRVGGGEAIHAKGSKQLGHCKLLHLK